MNKSDKLWREAYKNTIKIPFGIGKKIVCKRCNEITDFKWIGHGQRIGNCYQYIVKCKKCKSNFVDE